MSRTVCKVIYKYDELPDSIKEKACSNYRAMGAPWAWFDEGMDSIKSFCGEFNVKLSDWSVGVCAPYHWKSDATNRNFRGVKLKSIDREAMPTGYCLDCNIRYEFYDVFKRTGDALLAFNEAIDAGFKAIVADMEHQLTDEYIGEHMEINGYEFDEFGNIH